MLRCVPRADREEFVNVGVVLYCQAADFLDVGLARRRRPARARWTRGVDVDQVCEALAFVDGVCAGDPSAGGAAAGSRSGTGSASSRRRAAPCSSPARCTAGVTADPARQLEHLVASLVGG